MLVLIGLCPGCAAPAYSASGNHRGPLRVGVHLGDDSLDQRYREYVSLVGSEPAFLLTFVPWAESGGGFPTSFCDFARSRGALPVITWEPWEPWSDRYPLLADIAAGEHDDRISLWARAAAKWGDPVLIRFAHEMNGDWYPWTQAKDVRQRAEDYVRAWRHIHRSFARLGATNVRWVWCPNFEPPEGLERLYPGNDYVDWIGIDVYNRPPWPRSPRDALALVYHFAKKHGKPIILAEVGCAETFAQARAGHSAWKDKASWITALFVQIEQWPEIRGVIWFDLNKEEDWRIGSSPRATAAYKSAVLRLDPASTSRR